MSFGLLEGPMERVIALSRSAFGDLEMLTPGKGYKLVNWDDEGLHVVGRFQGPGGAGLPAVAQSLATFNEVTYILHAAAPDGTLAEILLVVRALPAGVSVGLVFMSNILESLGASWVIKLADAVMPRLGADAALLADRTDEAQVWQRLVQGEKLAAIVIGRAVGEDPLPPPLLALVRSNLCSESVLAQAREHGVAVRLSLRGQVVFSAEEL